jgi:acyl-CoA thioesterase-1
MMKYIAFAGLVLAAASVMAGEAHAWKFDAALLKPFWNSAEMQGESVLFVKDQSGDASVSLLFEPKKIMSITSSSGEVRYKEGSDYVFKPGSRTITLPAGSTIPFKTPEQLRARAGSQQFQLTHRDGNGEILFGATHEYHDMQVLVNYTHKAGEWTAYRPEFSGPQLPNMLRKLSNHEPVKVVLLGDSISTGCNASGWAGVAPYLPLYGDLVVKTLEAVYGSKVTLKNLSVGGKDSPWGAQIAKQQVAPEKPDLVILAFGMNDAVGRPAAEFQAYMKAQIDAVKQTNPACEFILVATMLGNPDWTTLHPELFPQYRNALAKLCQPGVVLADVTAVYEELLKHKKYLDISGNGVNHPNDFGHRIYAMVISSLLIKDFGK